MLIAIRIAASKFQRLLEWATIIAVIDRRRDARQLGRAVLGADRHAGGTGPLLAGLIAVRGTGSVAGIDFGRDRHHAEAVEAFYWPAITLSQTLGTALGDWTAYDTGHGYEGGGCVFATALAALALAYHLTNDLASLVVRGRLHPVAAAGATVVQSLRHEPKYADAVKTSEVLEFFDGLRRVHVACRIRRRRAAASVATLTATRRADCQASRSAVPRRRCASAARLASSSGTESLAGFMKSTATRPVMSATV